MKRLVGLLAALALLTGCATQDGGLRALGTVTAELTVVGVPALAMPSVDLDAGFADQPGDAGQGLASTMGPPGTSASGIGSFATVTAVAVSEGDTVTAGQPLVQLDDQYLRASLAAAVADAAVAKAQVDQLDAARAEAEDAREEVADKRADVVAALAELKDKRAEVEKAIKKLTAAGKDLETRLAQARRKRAELVAGRTAAEQALAALPPPPAPLPPDVPTREELQAAIAQLTAAITGLDAGLKKLDAARTKLSKGLTQAKAGRKKILAATSKATDGLARLTEAAGEIDDAIAGLARTRRLAVAAADAATTPVDLATTRLNEAAITAPEAGTVVSVAAAGDKLAPGAILVRIRPDRPARLTTWLSPAGVAGVCPGDAATVRADWLAPGETVAARVSRISPTAQFPPTSQATDEVHLTRAFLVELTTTADLPAGAPVTISIQPCRANASGTPGK